MRRSVPVVLAALVLGSFAPRSGTAGTLKDDGRAAVVTTAEGLAVVRPVGRERWTAVDARTRLFPGDVVRTEARGPNLVELALVSGARVVVGPGASVELPAPGTLRLLRGDVEVSPPAKGGVATTGPGGFQRDVAAVTWLRATDTTTTVLPSAPRWLEGYRASATEEWMGALLAKVDGKDVALSVGYHKVTVELRDQLARTTVEMSFVNATDARLEGVFTFPLPADASISGFGMWIGDELVEADLVERERARAIYEDILRRKKDPGLLEWEGGNLFKARVFPIEARSEKRVRLRYTQVLPLEGEAYRYRYALRSELLRAHPLRELSMSVSVLSETPLRDVSSATHPVTVRRTEHEAVAEFGAQQYVPDRDFELAVDVGRGPGVRAMAHRRGEDGWFMLLVAPPDPAAGGWQRDLAPEGAPVDLLVLADTSGSMDPAARATQAAFVGALLSMCGPEDRFRLTAFDVEPRPLVATPTAPTTEAVAAALDALEARRSLGWTDLEKAFGAALAAAGPTTQIVYVGDGVPTSGDADPVATAGRLRALGAGRSAPCHAVSTSSSYEQKVLEAVASVGGGSTRRADGGPVAAAKALLAEVARPGLRDARVEIVGVPTARVYPAALPNVPLGQQQVVLGRLLPGATATEATVRVTGTVAGAPVAWTAPLVVPAADAGNSFLPRLWARRHLDALLEEGRGAAAKAEIVEFSRRFELMTPYTSFLVLENDEDRARYGVERTVHMRDAERFFADAKDRAALEVARLQAEAGRRWRLGLRRQALAEIAGLRRDVGVPVAVGWDTGADGMAAASEADVPFEGPASNGLIGVGGGSGGAFRGRGGRKEIREQLSIRLAENADLREPSDPTPPMTPTFAMPAGPGGAWEGKDAESTVDEDGAVADKADRGEAEDDFETEVAEEAAKASYSRDRVASRRALAREVGRGKGGGGGGDGGAVDTLFEYRPFQRTPRIERRPELGLGWLGFPNLGAPPPPSPEPAAPAWPAEVLDVLRALDRTARITGGVRVTATTEFLHPIAGRVTGAHRAVAFGDARRAYTVVGPAGGASLHRWLTETERGVVNGATRLGRKRAASDAERGFGFLPITDRSLRGGWQDLANGTAAPTLARDGDRATLTFTTPGDAPQVVRLTVDTRRGVLLEEATGPAGGPFVVRRHGDFVDVAGAPWGRLVETTDDEGRVVRRTRLEVEALDAAALSAAFDARLAAFGDVVFADAADPKPLDALQAVRDGRADLPARLVAAIEPASRGEFDAMWARWAEVEPALGGKPGVAWMRLQLLGATRRGAELVPHALALAARVAADDDEVAPARAAMLDGGTRSLGARERLSVLRTVAPAWGRSRLAPALVEAMGRERLAAALEAADEDAEALAVRKALADAVPDDVGRMLAYANALRQGEDLAGAAAWVGDRCARGGPFLPGEVDAMAHALHGWLWELRDLPALAALAATWIERSPKAVQAYALRLTTGWLLGRGAETDAWVLAQLTAALPDPAARPAAADAARDAAVAAAIGNGWNFWTRTVPPAWRAPLADLAHRAARAGGRHGHLARRVLGDWRFAQLDEGVALRAALADELGKPDVVATASVDRLDLLLDLAEPALDAARRAALGERLVARWRAEPDPTRAEALVGAVLRMLPADGRAEARVQFLRERLGRAKDGAVRPAASALFEAITEAPHEAGREDEAFALLPRLLPADAPPTPASAADAAASAARSARAVAAWVHEGRRLAALGPPEAGKGRTRAQAAAVAREALAEARRRTAERLAVAVAAAAPPLHRWLEVERLGYAAEARADAARLEGEAKELLEAVPAGSTAPADAVLSGRAVVVLHFLATRRGAAPELADRLVAWLDARDTAKDVRLDPKAELLLLLTALDRGDALEARLATWIPAGAVDVAWREVLARYQAERGDLAAATATLEAAASAGPLSADAWTALAGWYLVRKEDTRRDAALDRALEAQAEWQLQQRLWAAASALGRRGDGVPEELDPEALRVLRHLMRKADHPGNYVGHVTQLYRPTKDFRVLEALVDGVVGHSPEAVYAFLGSVAGVVGDVHEEATLDTLAARAAAALAAATRDGDRRALRLLLTMVESRASMVKQRDPAHGRRAVEALAAAGEGAFADGERVLYAEVVAGLDPAPVPELATVALAQLTALATGPAAVGPERLRLERALAEALARRHREDDAIDRLTAALTTVRGAHGGRVPPYALAAHGRLVDLLVARQRFLAADTMLVEDAAREPASMRREALLQRAAGLQVQALAADGTTTLGAGTALFRATVARLEQRLATGPGYLVDETLRLLLQAIHDAAKRGRPSKAELAVWTLGFARDRLGAVLARAPYEATGLMQPAYAAVEAVVGPREALTLALGAVTTDPAWRARVGQTAWSALDGAMASWRDAAGALGDLEGPLLAEVLRRLEAALVDGEGDGGGFWHRGARTFWGAKARDFAGVAARVAEVHAARPATVLRAATYQRDGLGLGAEAAATLTTALAHGVTHEDVRATLATWHVEDQRFAEAWPLWERLVAERPDHLGYRRAAVRTLHGLDRDPAARRLLEDGVAGARARKTATAELLHESADIALAIEAADLAAPWAEEALRLRRERGAGPVDRTTAAWYVTLGRARAGLGDVDASVRALSAAIVAWGPDRQQRAHVLATLDAVLGASKDLAGHIARHDAEVAASGEDAPVLRKAYARVLAARRDPAAAAVQWRLARDLDALDPETHAGLVAALDAARDAAGALDALFASVRMAPRALEAYPDLAKRFDAAGQPDEAERARTSLVEAAPSEPDGHRALAGLREAAGRYDLAVERWRNVTRVRPDDPTGWLGLGAAQRRLGDAEGLRATVEHLLGRAWEERFGDVKAKAEALRRGR